MSHSGCDADAGGIFYRSGFTSDSRCCTVGTCAFPVMHAWKINFEIIYH